MGSILIPMTELIEPLSANLGLKSYRVKADATTVEEILKSLHLNDKFFAVLINGKRVQKSDIVHSSDELTILPKIAGGC